MSSGTFRVVQTYVMKNLSSLIEIELQIDVHFLKFKR